MKTTFGSAASVFDLYGCWSGLIAQSTGTRGTTSISAHDGDFFPESPLDYIEAIRTGLERDENREFFRNWPLRVDIDITQACNCHCIFCYSRMYSSSSAYAGAYADKDQLLGLLEELAAGGTLTVRFSGGGEPLLHPSIQEVLPLPSRLGLRCALLTNGDLLNESIADLVLAHVDHLRWSVNAATDATRRALHRSKSGANSLSRTAALVASIISRRDQNLRRPSVWATYLLMPSSLDEVVPAARMLAEVGVDSVSFRPIYHGLEGVWDEAQSRQLRQVLDEVVSLSTPPRFAIFIPRRPPQESRTLRPQEHFPVCISRRLRTVLEATHEGLALQTCGLWRGSGPHHGMVLKPGKRFADVWSSATLLPTHAPTDCPQCIDVSMNRTLNTVWAALEHDTSMTFVRVAIAAPPMPPTSVRGPTGGPRGTSRDQEGRP